MCSGIVRDRLPNCADNCKMLRGSTPPTVAFVCCRLGLAVSSSLSTCSSSTALLPTVPWRQIAQPDSKVRERSGS